MKARYLSLLLLILSVVKAYTQDQFVKQVSPLTPSAAALGKFGDIPVSLYTGIPNIQIPLYEIVVKDFKLPISLNYHASGVKVNDIASWVGAGWALNAGGVLSRQQRGSNDENILPATNSFLQTILSTSSTEAQKEAAASYLYLPEQVVKSDYESDIFSITAGNLSQKFFLDNNQVYCMPARKLSIKPEGRTSYPDRWIYFFDRWIVTDESGVKYIFGKTLDNSINDAERYYMEQVCGTASTKDEMVSSWYLNEIILPSGESINFTYETYDYCIDNVVEQTTNLQSLQSTYARSSTHYLQALRIKEITFPNGKIEFIPVPNTTRSDLHNDKVLEYINIYSVNNNSNQLIKSFKLNTNNPTGIHTTDDLNFRLALNSVEEVAPNGANNSTYSFVYKKENLDLNNDFGMPPRLGACDVWGYAGADAGILTKIIYPTGGYSLFEYQQNTARGIVETKQIGGETVSSINPLSILDDIRATGEYKQKSAGISLENYTGNDNGSTDFEIFDPNGVTISIDGYMTWGTATPCPLVTPSPGNYGSFYNCVSINLLKKNAGTGIFETYRNNLYFNTSFGLEKGSYRAILQWNNATAQIGGWFRIDLKWLDYIPPIETSVNEYSERTVGGVRIAKISDYDPVLQKTKVRKFGYDFNDEDTYYTGGTSGFIEDVPVFSYLRYDFYNDGIKWCSCAPNGCEYRTSTFNSSLLQTKSGLIGYRKVTVDYGNIGEGGRTVTYYISPKEQPNVNIIESQKFPFPSVTSYEWRRGLVDKQIDYKKEGTEFIPIRTIQNTYQFNSASDDPNFKLRTDIQIYSLHDAEDKATGEMYSTGYYKAYNTATESFYLKQSVIGTKSSAGEVISTNIFTQSSQSLAESSSTLLNSKGEQITSYTRYSSDIFDNKTTGTDPATLAIRYLINTVNMVNAPIEKYTVKIMADGTKYVTGGSLFIYCQDKPLPQAVYSLELSAPLLLSSFVPCKIDASGNFIKDSRYKLQVTYDLYDVYYNLLEQHKEGDIHTSYLWGYNNTFPVVKVDGLAYTGISSSIVSNVTNHFFTGSVNYTDIKTDVAWLKDQFINYLLNSISRHITFYTYAPLIGMTSQTDSNGVTVYYEYDEFGRLKLIRDQDGKILEQNQYHYQGQ